MGRGRMGNSGSRGSSSSGGHVGTGGRHGYSRTTVFIGGGGHYRSEGSPVIGIIVGAIFAFVGFCLLIGGLVIFSSFYKYGTVEAECVLNEQSHGWYYTTYEYTVDGKYYRERSEQSWEFPEDLGKIVTIYYLKSNPEKIYEEKPSSNTITSVVFTAVGFIFFVGGTSLLVACVKENKKKHAVQHESAEPVQSEDGQVRCDYCGIMYSAKRSSCPKCRARRLY